MHVPAARSSLADQVAAAVSRLRTLDVQKAPGIAEAIGWVAALEVLGFEVLDAEAAELTIGRCSSTATMPSSPPPARSTGSPPVDPRRRRPRRPVRRPSASRRHRRQSRTGRAAGGGARHRRAEHDRRAVLARPGHGGRRSHRARHVRRRLRRDLPRPRRRRRFPGAPEQPRLPPAVELGDRRTDTGTGAAGSDRGQPQPRPFGEDRGGDGDDDRVAPIGAPASERAVLRRRDFGSCTPEELARLRRLMSRMKVVTPRRPSRRRQASPAWRRHRSARQHPAGSPDRWRSGDVGASPCHRAAPPCRAHRRRVGFDGGVLPRLPVPPPRRGSCVAGRDVRVLDAAHPGDAHARRPRSGARARHGDGRDRRLVGRDTHRRRPQGVQRPLGPAGSRARCGRGDRVRRLGERRHRRSSGARWTGSHASPSDRVGQPAVAEPGLPTARRRDGGRAPTCRRVRQRAFGGGPRARARRHRHRRVDARAMR